MTADPRTLAADVLQDAALHNGASERNLASRLRQSAAFIESVVPLHDAWLAAKPPCKTCGGTHIIKKKQSNGVRTEFGCSDCPDGVQSFAEWVAGLVALWTAVHDSLVLAKLRHEAGTKTDADVIMALRRIGGTR